MNIEKQRELFKRYPLFLRRGPRNSLYPIDVLGIQAGDGWFGIVDEVCAQYERYLEAHKLAGLPEAGWLRAVQISETRGMLRVGRVGRGTLDVPEELMASLLKADALSAKTCERCGQPGERREGDLIGVACNRCYVEPHPTMSGEEWVAFQEALNNLLEGRQ